MIKSAFEKLKKIFKCSGQNNIPPGNGSPNDQEPASAQAVFIEPEVGQPHAGGSFDDLAGKQFREEVLSERAEHIGIVEGTDAEIPCGSERRDFSGKDGTFVTSTRKYLFLTSEGNLVPPTELAGRCFLCRQYVSAGNFFKCSVCSRVLCQRDVAFSGKIPLCPKHKIEMELKKDTWLDG